MKLDPETDAAAKQRYEVLSRAFEQAYADVVYPAFEAVAAIPDRATPSERLSAVFVGRKLVDNRKSNRVISGIGPFGQAGVAPSGTIERK